MLMLPVLATSWGGWAVITVENLPDHLVAREPVTLEFTIRQHGVEPLGGLEPSVVARSGRDVAEVDARPGTRKGRYVATITVPQPGDWTFTINSGFGPNRSQLLPLTAVATGAQVMPLSPGERGRHLFVGKGCVTCHVHERVESGKGTGAPDLTHRRFAPEYLSQFLADPQKMASRNASWTMPNLDLKQGEISALVAFLNTSEHARR
jgi:hypothetical protein